MSLLKPDQLLALRSVPVEPGANRVKFALALSGTTQADLAAATGFAQPYVSDVMRCRFKDITVSRASRFAEYFGCLIEDLFPGTNTNQSSLPFAVAARSQELAS